MESAYQVAIVTGASRGIGRATAIQLARDGYAVVVNYCHQREPAEEVVDQIRRLGAEAVAIQADVGNLGDHGRLLSAALQTWGSIDVLVNNAGITSPGRKDVLEATEESWDLVMATNLKGPFFLSQAAARAMISQPQSHLRPRRYLINISSISAYAVSLNRPDYCIAKAGMQMMTWLYADRLAEANVGVFEICPGVIASDMTAPVTEKYDQLIAEGLTPIRRWGQPEDVATAVSGVVRGQFPFSTGERINVDGGYHIRRL